MAEATEAELSGLKVIELKQRLEGLGLDKTGKKAELVARLLAASANNGPPTATQGGEVQQLRTQLAVLSQRHTTILGQHNALTQQHTTLKTQHGALGTQHSALTQQHGTLTTQQGTLALQHGRLKTHAGTLTEQQGTLKTQLSKLTEQHTALTQQHGALTTQHGTMSQQHTTLTQQHTTLTQQHTTLTQQQTTLTQQHTTLATQHQTLLAKHSMLEQMAFAPNLFLATRDGQVPVTRAWLQWRACERLRQLAAAAPASNVLTLPVVCDTEVVRLLVHAQTDGELPDWAAASCRKLGNGMQLLELSHALDFELGARAACSGVSVLPLRAWSIAFERDQSSNDTFWRSGAFATCPASSAEALWSQPALGCLLPPVLLRVLQHMPADRQRSTGKQTHILQVRGFSQRGEQPGLFDARTKSAPTMRLTGDSFCIDGKPMSCWCQSSTSSASPYFGLLFAHADLTCAAVVSVIATIVHPEPERSLVKDLGTAIVSESNDNMAQYSGIPAATTLLSDGFLPQGTLTLSFEVELPAHRARLETLHRWVSTALSSAFDGFCGLLCACEQHWPTTFDEVLLPHAAATLLPLSTHDSFAALPASVLSRVLQRTDLHCSRDAALVKALAPWSSQHSPEELAMLMEHADLDEMSLEDVKDFVSPGGIFHDVRTDPRVAKQLGKTLDAKARRRRATHPCPATPATSAPCATTLAPAPSAGGAQAAARRGRATAGAPLPDHAGHHDQAGALRWRRPHVSHTPCDTSFAIAIGRALLPVEQAWYAVRACRRYDEEAARRWFSSKKTSPLTGATLTDLTLVSNFAIKKQIDAYLEVRALLHHCRPAARRALLCRVAPAPRDTGAKGEPSAQAVALGGQLAGRSWLPSGSPRRARSFPAPVDRFAPLWRSRGPHIRSFASPVRPASYISCPCGVRSVLHRDSRGSTLSTVSSCARPPGKS